MIQKKKPIEIEASLRYICPNNDCGFSHWIFLREAKVKNFKIVCDCGTVFKPKRIKKIEVVFSRKKKIKEKVDKPVKSGRIHEMPECVKSAIKVMVSLGYSEKESKDSIINIYQETKIEEHIALAKRAISKIGGIDE